MIYKQIIKIIFIFYVRMIIFARTHTNRARARSILSRAHILLIIFKINIYTRLSFITNNLLYETLHFSKINVLKRHMPQVIKEKEEGSIDNHNN